MEPSENTKLFVGGVPRETTEDTLKRHFSQFGQVEESLIIRDRLTGMARGFGFVKFSDSSMASEALRVQHFILGRTVDVRPAKKGKSQEHSSGNASNFSGYAQSNKKIFVGGLPNNLTEQEFKSYFEKFGTVTDAVVIFDKENRRPRGFGFITFDSEDPVDNVLQNRFHELKSKMVEVKRAQPKDKNENYINYYDCYNTGLVFDYSPFPYGYNGYIGYPGYYGSWTGPGDWVSPIIVPSFSSHGFGKPSFHNLVSHNGVYIGGNVDWTNRYGNLMKNGEFGIDGSYVNRNKEDDDSGNLIRVCDNSGNYNSNKGSDSCRVGSGGNCSSNKDCDSGNNLLSSENNESYFDEEQDVDNFDLSNLRSSVEAAYQLGEMNDSSNELQRESGLIAREQEKGERNDYSVAKVVIP